MDNYQTNFKSVAHKPSAFLNWNGKPTSSTIKDKNYDIGTPSHKALEIIRSLNSEKTRSDLIDEFKDSGIVSDPIQANQVLRYLEDNQKIFPVEDSGLVNIITYRNISGFDRHQRQLQEEWLMHTKEFRPSCAIEESREIAALEIVGKKEEGVLH